MHHKRRGTTIALLTATALLQAACAPGPAVLEQSLPGRCAWLGGVRQELRLPLEVTRPGLLRIEVRERGITAAAALELTARVDASAGSMAGRTTLRSATAASPVERFGTLTLVGESSGSAAATVHVWSRDSAAIVAQVCVAAQLLRPDSATARTARLQAQADARAQARDWQGAFEAERAAARFAATSSEAATARHTMAQLEYGALDRKADSIPVISASLAEDAQTDRTVTGARLELLAKALAERTTLREVPVARVRALTAAAAARFATDPLARRELPRLTTLQSFLEYRLGDVDAAYRLSSRAADQCRSLGDGECFARARQNMAAIAEQRQNFPAALAFYREALGAIDPSRYPQLAANIFDNLGRLEDLAGLYSNSEQAQRRALQGYVAMGRCEGVRRSAARLGSMLMDVGSLADAAGYLVPIVSQSCDTLLHELAAADASSVPALDLAVSASGPRSLRPRLADPSAACRREQHLEDLSFESNRAVFRALLSLSQIAALEGRLTGATACLQAARGYAVDAPMRGELAHARGLLLLQLQQPRAAREEFSTALQLSLSSELEGSTELGLARAALMLKDAGEARLHAYRALELGCRRADVSEIASALQALAAVESLSADHAGATQTLRMALGLIEQVPLEGLDAERRALYLSTQHELFADLTDQLAAEALGSQASSEALWRAFGSAEEGHARSLRFALRQASQEQLVAGSALLKAARAPARNDSGRYEQLMQTLAGLRPGDSPAGAARLLEALKLLQGTASLQSGLDRAALEAQLQRLGAVLVEYAAGVHDLYAFVADGHGLRLLRLGDRERIAASAAQLGEALRANQTEAAAIAPAARALADQVLVPLQPYLDRKRVILVPDDALHTIPFALLPWRSPGVMELLVQHVQLSMLPAASMLSDSQPPASTGQRFVLLGDPVFRRLQWER
ncbi:MAG TPA: hypothetical protein VME21_10160, partial [Steroidobacteraceae bacterium]|nr:hypothetical protein [Steroidobacteraceae bacterium]